MSERLIPITVPLGISTDAAEIPLNVSTDAAEIELGVDMAITPISGKKYEGDYRITPTDHDQIIPMAGLYADEDVVVEAIPSNYGLITWNGSVLTVS